MKRIHGLLLFAVWSLFSFASPDSAHAQTQYIEYCRAELAQTQSGDFDHFLAHLKLTNALQDNDLRTALTSAKSAIKLAEPHGRDAVIVAKMYVAMLTSTLANRSAADASLQDSDFQLSSEALPELRLHFYMALLDREVWTGDVTERVKPFLEKLMEFTKDAASECNDPHLIAKQRCQELLLRSTRFLPQAQTTTRFDELLDELNQDLESYPMMDLGIVLNEANAIITGLTPKSEAQQAELVAKARQLAVQAGYRFRAARCVMLQGIVAEMTNQLDLAVKYYDVFLTESRNLGAQPFVYRAYRRQAAVYQEQGNYRQAIRYLSLAENSKAFQDQPFLFQQYFYEEFQRVHEELGNRVQARRYEKKILSSDARERLKRNQESTFTYGRLLSGVIERGKQDKQQLQQAHQIAAAKLDGRITTLKTYLFIASALSLLLSSWIVFRIRLNQVNKKLDSEKDNVRQSEQECAELANRLHRIQRMESLGLMAGSVAHDFNNILVGVLGNAEIIQMKTDFDDVAFVKQRVESIITSAEKAAGLSRQMLAYAGKQYIAKEAIDLNELVSQYESVLKSACSPNQTLDFQLCRCAVVSKIDRTQVEQVLLNLVTNAVQASSGSATITIRTGVESVDHIDQDASIFGTRTLGGEFCYVEVTDQGSGISAEDLERIFEPFYSNSDVGRGLGLSVVYGVTKGHDGLIRCQSELGVGTTFRVLLPESREEAVATISSKDTGPDEHEPPIADDAPPRTVLVIDDEASVLDLCSQLLQFRGWEVITATNGTEGLAAAVDHVDEISCILLDVVMPEMGANEVLREIENRQIQTPVVLMSGFSQTKLEFFLDRPNVVEIVEKPFHADEIQAAVQAAFSVENKLPNPIISNPYVGHPQHAR